MVLIGRSSDRSGERFLHVAIPTAIGAVGFVATGLLLKAPIPAMIALTVAAVGDYCTRGPFWALPGKFLIGKRGRPAPSRSSTRWEPWAVRSASSRLPEGSHRHFWADAVLSGVSWPAPSHLTVADS